MRTKNIKKIIWTTAPVSVVIPSIAISCNQEVSKEKEIDSTNEISQINIFENQNLSETGIDSLKNLEHNSKIIKLKNSKTDLSKAKWKNLLDNEWLQNNLFIDRDELNKVLIVNGYNQNTLKNIEASIIFRKVYLNRSTSKGLIVPIQISRKLNIYGAIYKQVHTYNLELNGLTEDSKIAKYRQQVESFLNTHNFKDITFRNTNDNDKYNLTDLMNLSEYQLNKLLSVNYTNTENTDLYSNKTWEEQKNNKKDLFNIHIKSVEYDHNNLENIKVNYVVSYGQTGYYSGIIKSYSKSFTNTLKLSKKISQKDIEKFLSTIVKPHLKYNLSIFNYDFSKFNKKDFLIDSQYNDLVKFSIKNVEKSLKLPNNATYTLVTKSKIKELNNVNLTIEYGVPKHAYLFETDLQDTFNKYNLIIGELTQDRLNKITTSLYDYLNYAKLIPSGYDEMRGFYASEKFNKQLHLGEDVMAHTNTVIYAPFDAQVIAIYRKKTQDIGTGIGTTLMLKIKTSDIKNYIDPETFKKYYADSEYLYTGFIHLDGNKTMALYKNQRDIITQEKEIVYSVSPTNPIEVKKGEPIGVIASSSENGGWMPHVHIATVRDVSKEYNPNGFLVNDRSLFSASGIRRISNYYNESKKIYITGSVRVDGVITKSAKIIKKIDENGLPLPASQQDPNSKKLFRDQYMDILEREKIYGLTNPNTLFQFRDNNTYQIDLEQFFGEVYNGISKNQD